MCGDFSFSLRICVVGACVCIYIYKAVTGSYRTKKKNRRTIFANAVTLYIYTFRFTSHSDTHHTVFFSIIQIRREVGIACMYAVYCLCGCLTRQSLGGEY